MSMTLTLIEITSSSFNKIQTNPQLIEGILENQKNTLEELKIDLDHQYSEIDYLTLTEALDALAEEEGEDPEEPHFSPSGELNYDTGYGNVMFIEPSDLSEVYDNITWELIAALDENADELISHAVENKNYLLFFIS
tara:strand:+ start:247 stop:657 length:411 start_codon:yes stop_codon:yes gene_type:complete